VNFEEFPPWINAAIFAAAAIAVWIAGTKLARYADAIAEQTGIGRELLGVLLLGGVTSLPELAVATTATLQGTPQLSVNDVLGSASINLVVLAIADAISRREALTSVPGSPVLMVQGVFGMMLLAIAAAPIITGDTIVFGMGAWSWVMLATYLIAVRLITRSNSGRAWKAPKIDKLREGQGPQEQDTDDSVRKLILLTVAVGAVILVAGFLLARTGEGLAKQTGLGTSFFGAVFLALATSLPEWSTVIAATRLRRYEMAISDIFGTNLFNVMIIVLIDALYRKGPVMLEGGPFAAFGALLALLLTSFLLIGMLERRDRTILRMGWDSLAILLGYAGGVVVLHGLR
jgi:cation:H+ antiporter